MIDRDGRSQKIKSYFINEKIPSEERDCVPLIADEKQIIWILGYRMSSACQITVQTHRVLEIKSNGGKKVMSEKITVLVSEKEVDERIELLGKQISKEL